MPTPRRTPRKLKFDVIEETPAVISRQNRICVLVEKSRKRWVPVMISRTSRPRSGIVEAIFPDGNYSKIALNESRILRIQADDQLRLNDDSHTYTVLNTLKSDQAAQFQLENGDDMVELVSRRGGRTIRAPIKNIFFHDVDKFEPFGVKMPSSVTPKRKVVAYNPSKVAQAKKSVLETGSPLPITKRTQSIIYNPPATPVTGDVFSDCVFVVVDDFIGKITSSLSSRGAQIVKLLSDLMDTTDIPKQISYTGPKSAKFFAVIGNAITPAIPFLEALAIGWPCLNTAFVHDCISSNSFLPWQDYLLGIVSPEGYLRSQNCFDYKHQWDVGLTLEQQFGCRSAVLAGISTPLYISSSISSELLVLMALACHKFNLIETGTRTPPGTIFIDAGLHGPVTCGSEIKHRMCRQSRLEHTVTINAQWLIQCILNQKVL